MPDMEKVIKGLEVCLKNIDQPDCPNDCPYISDCSKYENRVVFQPLMRDTLTLLKEQEAVKPITEHHLFLCPVCKNTLFREQKFCHECGKRIDWEGR